jgi:hypothetical protein
MHDPISPHMLYVTLMSVPDLLVQEMQVHQMKTAAAAPAAVACLGLALLQIASTAKHQHWKQLRCKQQR